MSPQDDDDVDAVDCIQGPIEQIGDRVGLRIPLDQGGNKLVECTQGVGRIEGDALVITFPGKLVEAGGLRVGLQVVIGRKGTKFALWHADKFHSGTSGPQ